MCVSAFCVSIWCSFISWLKSAHQNNDILTWLPEYFNVSSLRCGLAWGDETIMNCNDDNAAATCNKWFFLILYFYIFYRKRTKCHKTFAVSLIEFKFFLKRKLFPWCDLRYTTDNSWNKIVFNTCFRFALNFLGGTEYKLTKPF